MPVPIEGPPSFPHGPGGRGEQGLVSALPNTGHPFCWPLGKGGQCQPPPQGGVKGGSPTRILVLWGIAEGAGWGALSPVSISHQEDKSKKKKKKRACLCRLKRIPWEVPSLVQHTCPRQGGDLRPERRSHRPSAPAGLQRGKALSSHLRGLRGGPSLSEVPLGL